MRPLVGCRLCLFVRRQSEGGRLDFGSISVPLLHKIDLMLHKIVTCTHKVDLESTYFAGRLAAACFLPEPKRFHKLIKKQEHVADAILPGYLIFVVSSQAVGAPGCELALAQERAFLKVSSLHVEAVRRERTRAAPPTTRRRRRRAS